MKFDKNESIKANVLQLLPYGLIIVVWIDLVNIRANYQVKLIFNQVISGRSIPMMIQWHLRVQISILS